MPKESHKVVKFQRLVRRMWSRRTSPLLALVGKKRMGPKAQFSKKYRTSRIQDLQEIAGELQLPKLVSAIKTKTQQKTVRFSKGLRREAKWHILQNRMSRGPHGKHLVYVIWDSRGGCSKVGRSDVGIRRLRGQRLLLPGGRLHQLVLSKGKEEKFAGGSRMRVDPPFPPGSLQSEARALEILREVLDLPSTETG
jgi:hypothetical protein